MNRSVRLMAFGALTVPAFLGAAAGILALMYPMDALPHEATNTAGQPLEFNYPWSCCSAMDCAPAGPNTRSGEILERPEGYVIQSTGEVIPYADKRVKDSPNQDFHWCAHKAGIDANKTICLFVPPRGF